MRIVPLLPSSSSPDPWRPLSAVELAWDGRLHPGWSGLSPVPEIHALHLAPHAWGAALGEIALDALRARTGADFLVLRADAPEGRTGYAAFMSTLEGLLEVAPDQGFKLALRPAPGAAPALVRHLREVRGEAVGFCWDSSLTDDLACFADRLFCAVGEPGDDFSPIQRLGYRWNLAIPALDPVSHREAAARIERDFPPVLFPEMPEPPDPPEAP